MCQTLGNYLSFHLSVHLHVYVFMWCITCGGMCSSMTTVNIGITFWIISPSSSFLPFLFSRCSLNFDLSHLVVLASSKPSRSTFLHSPRCTPRPHPALMWLLGSELRVSWFHGRHFTLLPRHLPSPSHFLMWTWPIVFKVKSGWLSKVTLKFISFWW